VRIAFNIAVGVWVLSEWGIRRRSHLNREGSRLDHGSTLVVVASTVAGVVGALALARRYTVRPFRRPAGSSLPGSS
jgi:hypothetical protein